MIEFTSIRAMNIFACDEMSYDFVNNKMTMIFGEVDNVLGADSNGAGKSTIFEIITLAITGKTSRDVTKEDFIRDGETKCFVEIVLNCSIGIVRIQRCYFKNKTAACAMYVNNSEVNFTSINEFNQFIYEIIGIGEEDLFNFYILNQDDKSSFITSSDTKQKQIISRICNFGKLDSIVKNLEEEQKVYDDKITQCNANITSLQNLSHDLESLIEKEKELQHVDIEKKILPIKNIIVNLRNKIKENEEKLVTLSVELANNNSVVNNITKELVGIENNEEEIVNLKLKITNNSKSLRELNKDVSLIEKQLNNVVKCPKCNNEFSIIDVQLSNEDIKTLKLEKRVTETYITELNSFNQSYEDRIEQIESEFTNKKNSVEVKLQKAKRELNNTKSTINSLKDDNELKLNTIDVYEEQIVEIKKEHIMSDNLSTLQAKYKDNMNKIIANNSMLKVYTNKIERCKFYSFHFGKKGFKTYLANQGIKAIENYTNMYLEKFKIGFTIHISGFKLLKSGELREKIEIFISNDGVNKSKFNRLSGGQKSRISICSVLALQKLINLTNQSGGINFLGLDETFDGLDSSGRKNIVEILEESGMTCLIISHDNTIEKSMFENKIVVKMINGITKINT